MKYKVLHLFASAVKGGAERSMVFLADNLQKSGYVDNLMGVPRGTFVYEESERRDLKTAQFAARGSFDPKGIINVVKLIKKHKIDIVHVHQGKIYWIPLVAKIFCPRVKIVLHRRQDTRHAFYSKFHYYLANAVITVSQAVANGLIKYEKVSAKKITVIYNGVNFERFLSNADSEEIIKKYNLNGKVVIGTVGAIGSLKGKGQIYLIEAAAQLREKYPDLRYLIVGSGAGLPELKQFAKDLKVDDIVYFTDYQEEVQKYVSAMDIFTLLSWDTEGLPNVVIEAQSLKKPVIATNIGGIPEAFINGKTGIMIEPSNVCQLVDAIKKLISEPALAKDMGDCGKEYVQSKFTVENMVSKTLEVYKKIMTRK